MLNADLLGKNIHEVLKKIDKEKIDVEKIWILIAQEILTHIKNNGIVYNHYRTDIPVGSEDDPRYIVGKIR